MSDFSASEESQRSDSSTSSLDDSDEESPPPAKRRKKVLCHPSGCGVSMLISEAHHNMLLVQKPVWRLQQPCCSSRTTVNCKPRPVALQGGAVTAKADRQKAKSVASGQKATKRSSASKAAESKRAATTAICASKKQSARGPARKSAHTSSEAEEVLPMKPRAASGKMNHLKMTFDPASHQPKCDSIVCYVLQEVQLQP